MTAKRALLVLVVLIGLPYACSPVYRFPEPAPFAGTQFYNPYAGLRGAWKRVNLHAHGTAWGGLTNGQQASEDVVRTYRALGYDLAGVSNYHAIAAHDGVDTLPLYEHGYNISKRHQLAIGARRVEWLDFPLLAVAQPGAVHHRPRPRQRGARGARAPGHARCLCAAICAASPATSSSKS